MCYLRNDDYVPNEPEKFQLLSIYFVYVRHQN